MSDAGTQVVVDQENSSNGHPGGPELAGEGKTAVVFVSERRILPALKAQQSPGFFSTVFGLILFMPLKVLSLIGLYHSKKRELYLSGQPLIDSSALKPLAQEAPEKRKHHAEEESTEDDEDEDEEEMQGVEDDPYKYLRDGVEYDSQEDEDYMPPPGAKAAHEDSASDEFQEGETDEDDINVDPKDIIQKKTRGKKGELEISDSNIKMKAEERTGPITLDEQTKNEEKAQ